MIYLITLAFIIIFLINFSVNLFLSLSIGEKFIIASISTILVLYYLFNKKEELSNVEDQLIKYIIIFLIIVCILKLIEYLMVYGLKGPNSVLLIISIILFAIITINIYLFNASL